MSKVLVAYATRTGSTVGVAEAIGKTLAEKGIEVDVRPVQEVTDITPYRAVVVGSAIQGKKWLPEAMQFVEKNKTVLCQKPFATFTVCITMAMKNEEYRLAVQDWLAPVRMLVNPVSEGFFAGVLDFQKVPTFMQRLMFRFSVAMGAWPEGDNRDWNAIQGWADQLATRL